MPRFSGGTTCSGALITRPSMLIRPSLGAMNPAIIRNVVVFPHPDGPSNETNSPGSSASDTPLTATVAPNRRPTRPAPTCS